MSETIDLINQFIQLGCMAAVAVISARRAIQRGGAWVYQLLAGAFGCYFLGDFFYTLHLMILGNYAIGFSAADLSYLGSYYFLLSIDLGLTGEWADAEKESAKRHRRAALTAPAAVIILHAVYVYLAGNPVNNALFCIPLAFLSYYSLLLFLMSGGREKPASSMHQYHGTVLLFLVVENMMFLTSSIGLNMLFSAFDVMLSATVLLISHAAGKGAAM